MQRAIIKNYFFNRFREEDNDIYSRLACPNEIVEKEILCDTNYLSIRATAEYETNKNPLTPTNKILTSLLSPDRFMFILRYGFAYVKYFLDGGITTIQKHVMRYQQLFAMFSIAGMLNKETKRGVIWHTQGSVKTALAYHCVKFLTDYYFLLAKIREMLYLYKRIIVSEGRSVQYAVRTAVHEP